MKKTFSRLFAVFIATLISLSAAFVNSNRINVHAQGSVVKEIIMTSTEVQHAGSFSVRVRFGGSNTKVASGQKEEITFLTNRARVNLPSQSIPLNDAKGVRLGTVTFGNDKAIIEFNETAAGLEDVEGEFYFESFAYYTGSTDTDGNGSITIFSGNIRKDINVIYKKGGIGTEETYSKRGVWLDTYPDGNAVDWAFTFNAAHKSTEQKDYTFTVTDTLPDTMLWNETYNQTKPHVVYVNGQWINLESARNLGIKIQIDGQDLMISIPKWISQNGGWIDPLDGKEVVVRLTAQVKDEVMKDQSITHVINNSEPHIEKLNWEIDLKNTADSVKIIRQGGWAAGTVPGELKIVKVLDDKTTPIKDVEFTLERKDGEEIEIRQPDGSSVKKGKTVTLITNEEGIAGIKGLKAATYIVKESKAPEWISFDPAAPIQHEFVVSLQDSVGKEYHIENMKKKTDIKVTKTWLDSNGEKLLNIPKIEVRLYRNDQPIEETATLDADTLTYTWKNLDLSDDRGNMYVYTVKEVGEDNKLVKVNDNVYTVSYGGDVDTGLTITNKELPPVTPLRPALTDINVRKEWKDDHDGQLIPKVEKIIVALYKDGIATGEERELTKQNGWKATFENLAVSERIDSDPYEYTVQEVDQNGNAVADNQDIQIAGKWFKVNVHGSLKDGFVIINKEIKPFVPLEPAFKTIKVTKEWIGTDAKDAPEVTIYLIKNGTKTDRSIKLNKDNNWTGEFKELPSTDDAGKANIYTVMEAGEIDGKVTVNGTEYKVSYVGGKVINTKQPKTTNIPQSPKTADETNSSAYAFIFGISTLLFALLIRNVQRKAF